MFCSQCGTKNNDGAAFCAGCGAPLETELSAKQEAPDQELKPQSENIEIEAPANNFQAPQNDFSANQSYTPTPAPSLPGKGQGIAGMVLGIVSLVMMCTFYIALPCAIVGLILSITSKSKAKKAGMKNGFAVAGIVTSAIGLGLGVLYIIFAVIGAGILMEYGYDLEEFLEEYENYYYEYSTAIRNFFKK